jgi:hypothetical protein
MAKKDRDGERDEEKKYKGGEKKRKHHDQPEEGQHANSASKRSKTEKSGGKVQGCFACKANVACGHDASLHHNLGKPFCGYWCLTAGQEGQEASS